MKKLPKGVIGFVLLVFCSLALHAAESQVVRGHVPRVVTTQKLQPIGLLPAETTLQLVIGLPLRDRQGLQSLLMEMYIPGTPNYRHFLKPAQFTERFGPTEQDYRALIEFAKASGLAVTGTSSNRMLLDVRASVSDIERVFHTTLRTYQHPTEQRTFFAPDADPSLDLKIPVLHISGLDSFIIPHRIARPGTSTELAANGAPTGSGPSSTYLAQDIRTAYLPGVTLSGAGQSVGLLEYNGYYTDLINDYKAFNGIVGVTPTVENWALDGFNGNPTGTGYQEAEVDIEMAMAMAPGLDSIIVYELPPPTGNNNPSPPDDALNLMAEQDLANQLSSSWEYNLSANTDQIFQQLAAQGQSFFQSSGDGGGRTGTNVFSPFDDAYVTLVGATELATSGAGGTYSSEAVYNEPDPSPPFNNFFFYSGGGISPTYSIPWWQQGVSMASNGGSTTQRNMPDVAILGYQAFAYYSETGTKSGGYSGTSVAAPLWAGFMACVNQQASADGLPAIGFANPALYAIGKGGSYSSCFHDITSGNNKNPLSPTQFTAVAGYDLCSGWGTPKGQNLINALCVNPVPGNIKWVQFTAPSGGNGSWAKPFKTMATAVAAVPANGTIIIKGPSSTSETLSISNIINILSFGGASTVGH